MELEIDGESYDVTVKVASDVDSAVDDGNAEYDDALAVARETEAPIREIVRRADREVLDERIYSKTGTNSTRRPHSGAV